MHNLATRSPLFKPEKVVASCDTAGLFCCWPERGMRCLLEDAQQGEIVTRKVKDKSGNYLGTIFAVNRPKLAVLPVMDRLVDHVPYCYRHRFDIAYDFTSPDRDQLLTVLDKHGELKWASRRAKKVQVESTIYAASERPRELALYPKWDDTVRLELRFTGRSLARTFKWFGASRFEHLPRLNPRKLLTHHFKLLALKDSYVTKAIRDAVKEDRERHLRTERGGAFQDRYRARSARSVKHTFDSMDVFGFKRHVWRSSRFVEELDMSWIGVVPVRLKWPEVEGRVIENTGFISENGRDWHVVTQSHLAADRSQL
jgi:hypothetical protein